MYSYMKGLVSLDRKVTWLACKRHIGSLPELRGCCDKESSFCGSRGDTYQTNDTIRNPPKAVRQEGLLSRGGVNRAGCMCELLPAGSGFLLMAGGKLNVTGPMIVIG